MRLHYSRTISNLRTLLLFFSILILLFPASNQERIFTPGMSVFTRKELSKRERGDGVLLVNSMIGSRPPQCERRCLACSHCQAIQVPATPQARSSSSSVHSSMIADAKDDSSNYKPMNWKCKCGSFIFNP